jgi:hypothetical protein
MAPRLHGASFMSSQSTLTLVDTLAEESARIGLHASDDALRARLRSRVRSWTRWEGFTPRTGGWLPCMSNLARSCLAWRSSPRSPRWATPNPNRRSTSSSSTTIRRLCTRSRSLYATAATHAARPYRRTMP